MPIERAFDFCNNYSLRITPRSALNDPFELRPSFNFIEKCILSKSSLNTDFKKYLSQVLIESEDFSTNIIIDGKSFYEEMGIVSFTKRKNNLLMWSHYADEHRGICVEFKIDETFNRILYTHDAMLEQVNYDNERYDHENVDDPNALELSLVHKSLDWEYEQEYRITMLLSKCDNMVLTPNGDKIHLLQFSPSLVNS